MDRRSFLRLGLLGAGSAVLAPRLLGSALPGAWAADGPYGPLQLADVSGIQLPTGFTSRVVARSGQLPTGTGYVWHSAPDGGACFSVPGGGWVYASNSELGSGAGGVGALRFDPGGTLSGAYRVLGGTNRNCAGGAPRPATRSSPARRSTAEREPGTPTGRCGLRPRATTGSGSSTSGRRPRRSG